MAAEGHVRLLIEARNARVAARDVQGVSRAVDRTGASTDRLASRSRAAERAQRAFHSTLKATVRAGTVGVAGMAVVTAGAVKKAADFEQQMSALGAATNTTGARLKMLEAAALKAGASTAYSASQAASAQTELAKGGLSASQILSGGLTSTLSLAAAGTLDLAEAAKITANALNIFGLEGKDAGSVADAMATAANATTADVADFGMALAQGGAVAKTAGLSFNETMVALEALAKAGVKNSDAGTSLKTSLLQLLSPTDKQAGLAKELGLSFIGANGKMKSMADTSAMLRKQLGGMTQAQRTAALATLAGTDGVRTLTALYDAGPEKLRAYAKGLEEQGTAAATGKKKQDNLKGSLEQLSGAWETLQLAFMSSKLPLIRRGIDGVTKAINTISLAVRSGEWSHAFVKLDKQVGGGGRIASGLETIRRAVKDFDFGKLRQQAAGMDWSKLGSAAGFAGDVLKQVASTIRWLLGLPFAKEILGAAIAFGLLNKATGGSIIPTIQLVTASINLTAALVASTASTNAFSLASMRARVASMAATASIWLQTAAVRASMAATWLWTAATAAATLAATVGRTAFLALAVAMAANPIGAVVVALAALTAGLVYAYTKVGWFRNGVDAAWGALKAFWGWLSTNGPKLLNFIPFVSLVKNLGTVKSKLGDLLGYIGGLPGKFAAAGRSLFAWIPDAFKSAINFVIDGWNSLQFKIPGFDPPGPGPKFGGVTIGVPDIPRLAQGGVATRAGAAIVGDGGEQEIYMERGAQVRPLDAFPDASSSASAQGLGPETPGPTAEQIGAAVAQFLAPYFADQRFYVLNDDITAAQRRARGQVRSQRGWT